MNPCKNCIKNLKWLGCTDYTCDDYQAWLKEVRERIRYERFADPQEPEQLQYQIDDREI